MIWKYWYFDNGVQFETTLCCHDVLIISLEINNITIITVKGIDYHCLRKYEAFKLLENHVLDSKGFM